MSQVFHFKSTDKDGNEMEFRVEIDENAIAAKLAPRLRKSKLGGASSMDGAIKATRIKANPCPTLQIPMEK